MSNLKESEGSKAQPFGRGQPDHPDASLLKFAHVYLLFLAISGSSPRGTPRCHIQGQCGTNPVLKALTPSSQQPVGVRIAIPILHTSKLRQGTSLSLGAKR